MPTSRVTCLLSSTVLSGCIIGPTVDTLGSKNEVVDFLGYSIDPSQQVAIDCRQVGKRTTQQIGATTTSDSEPSFSMNGGSVYVWTKSAAIPSACWNPVGPGIAAARVFARNVADGAIHYHVEDMTCVGDELADGQPPDAAGLSCAETFRHLEFRAPSGIAAGANPLTGMGVVQTVATGFGWAEGPVWDADDGSLVFTDIAADRIHKVKNGSVSTVVAPTGAFTNGLDYDASGNRLECQHKNQRIVRRSASGSASVLASTWNGLPFNSPNDAIGHSSGAVFFTDPIYGSLPDLGNATPQQPYKGVYRVSGGVVSLVSSNLQGPNGIALSPDQTKLYVADYEANVVVSHTVAVDGSTGDAAPFATPSSPDGLAVDVDGNVYVAALTGIDVFKPDGTSWGSIPIAQKPTNVAFGNSDRKTLYVTAPTAVYRVSLGVPGLPAAF
jgi:gluconolactonase